MSHDLSKEEFYCDLLIRIEGLLGGRTGTSVSQILTTDAVIGEAVRHDPRLADELKRHFEAIQAVDRVLKPAAAVVPWPEISGYEIVSELAVGGMGIVYRARQVALNRLVAIKLLLAGRFASRGLRDRFRAEAEAVALLQHPNIIQVHESGEVEGTPYLVMEFAAGGNLKKKMAAGLFPVRQAAQCVATLARAVQHAHAHGIVHRDLKPSNVLLTRDGTVKIADFGLAKRLSDDGGVTRSGETPGTPNYMAPEQARDGRIVPATDVYALGAILYELLTGRPPFVGDSSMETLMHVCHHEPVPPSRLRPELSRELEAICLKCLEKRPDRRYASAQSLAEDLDRFQTGRVTVARPAGGLRRVGKWALRNPAIASPATVCVFFAATLMLGGWLFSIKTSYTLDRVERLRVEAEASRRIAVARQKTLQRHLYAVHMKQAADAWRHHDGFRLLQLVGQYEGEEGSSLRSFEWYFLHRQCHGELFAFLAHPARAMCTCWTRDIHGGPRRPPWRPTRPDDRQHSHYAAARIAGNFDARHGVDRFPPF